MYFPSFSFFSEPRYQQPRAPTYYRSQRPFYSPNAYDDSSEDDDDYGNFSFYSRQQQPRRNVPQTQPKKQYEQPKAQCSCNCGHAHESQQFKQPKVQNESKPTTASPGYFSQMNDTPKTTQASPIRAAAESNTQQSTAQSYSKLVGQSTPKNEKESPMVQDDISTDDDTTIIQDLDFNYWEEVGVSPNKNNLDDLLIEEYFSPEIEAKAKQLEPILKRPFRECLHLVQENPNESLSSLIQIAIKKYTAVAATATASPVRN